MQGGGSRNVYKDEDVTWQFCNSCNSRVGYYGPKEAKFKLFYIDTRGLSVAFVSTPSSTSVALLLRLHEALSSKAEAQAHPRQGLPVPRALERRLAADAGVRNEDLSDQLLDRLARAVLDKKCNAAIGLAQCSNELQRKLAELQLEVQSPSLLLLPLISIPRRKTQTRAPSATPVHVIPHCRAGMCFVVSVLTRCVLASVLCAPVASAT